MGWDLGIWLDHIWFTLGGSHEQINMNGLGIERRWRSLLSNSLQTSERQRGERKSKAAAQTRRKKERRDRKKEGGVPGFLGTVGSKHYASYARDNFLSLSLPSRCATRALSRTQSWLLELGGKTWARAQRTALLSLSPPSLSLSYSCYGNPFPYTAGFGALWGEYLVHCNAVQTCARTHALNTSHHYCCMHSKWPTIDLESDWLNLFAQFFFLSGVRHRQQLSLSFSHTHTHTHSHTRTHAFFFLSFSPFFQLFFFLYYLASDFLVFRAVILKITFFNPSIFHIAPLWSYVAKSD